jgi:glycosyltransferase involved in cell wall biosynthesis
LKNPVLSVLLVVLNNKQFIASAIQNYLDQQCAESELVIIDGVSTDGTKEIIESMAKDNPQIRWISEKDKGQSDAMNKAIRMAKGEYISFLNVDDYYEPGTLNQIIQLIKSGETAEFIVGNCNVWDSEGNLIYVNRPKKLKPWHILSGKYLPVNPTAYFYKKSIHDKVGFYAIENHYNMDVEFIIMASTAAKMKYFDRTWGNFRVLPDTKTGSDAEAGKMWERKNQLFERKLNELGFYIFLRTKLFLYYLHYKNIFKKKWQAG